MRQPGYDCPGLRKASCWALVSLVKYMISNGIATCYCGGRNRSSAQELPVSNNIVNLPLQRPSIELDIGYSFLPLVMAGIISLAAQCKGLEKYTLVTFCGTSGATDLS